MKTILFRIILPVCLAAAFIDFHPRSFNWLEKILLWFMSIGFFWVLDVCLSPLFWLWNVCRAAHETHREFQEAEDDAVIECEGDIGPLIECDTAGVPTPPNEVQVYEYLWNPGISAYELSRVIPLSEYTAGDPEAAPIVSRTPPPAIIPGAPVPVRRIPESEFDEVERRLHALPAKDHVQR